MYVKQVLFSLPLKKYQIFTETNTPKYSGALNNPLTR